VNAANIAGLLEALAEKPGDREDLYRLVEELKVDSDHLLLLTEATEMLGFATVAQGDINLTSLGQTFADASILARKEIFATRIRRLPTIRWMLNMLTKADKHELEWDVIQSALELDFPPEEAGKQIEVAVNWGRYAELFAYDKDKATIYLESTANE
jgi:NitT/TauT family transport system ATP-binding protein